MEMSQSTLDLPAELWAHIFDLAADDDLIFQYGLQSSFSLHAWWKGFHGVWLLRSPREALNYIQKRSYFTKKAVVSTCRKWRAIGSESLFRYLFFDHPSKLLALCALLHSSTQLTNRSNKTNGFTVTPKLCWWTRRIHVANRDYHAGIGMPELERALLQLLSYCPNLKILVLDFEWSMPVSLSRERTFGTVIDTLASTASKTLRTVHWHVPRAALHKIIWSLDALPYLVAIHIHLSSAADNESDHEEEEDAKSDSTSSLHLGAAASIQLTLPYLQQLSLRGSFQDFLEQAAEWSLPSLSSLSLDSGFIRTDPTSSSGSSPHSVPDTFNLLSFLLANAHGTTLRLLDLQCIPALSVSRILDACPNLTAFAFNADWRLMPTSTDGSAAEIVRVPHTSIRTIGLHGLLYAFDVGIGAAAAASSNGSGRGSGANITAKVIRRSNDLNVAALTKRNFPRLERVRVLSPVVLQDLERENGPRGEGISRYDRWWSMLSAQSIRLEDCTGAELGTLPMDEEEEDDDDDDEVVEEMTKVALETKEERTDAANPLNASAEEDDEDDDDDSDSDEAAYQSAEETFTQHLRPESQSSESESDSEDDEEEVANELDPARKHVNELRDLLAECRAMEETREPLPYTSLVSASAPVPPGVTATVRRASGQVDYSAIYQHFTGNGNRRVSSGSHHQAYLRSSSNEAPRLQRQVSGRERNRPRMSFGISDDNATDEAGRLPSDYSPALSEGTLLGIADASPAVSSNATLVGEDEYPYGPGYGYGYAVTDGQGQGEEDDEDDGYEEDELEEEEDHHPVAALRKLVEECRAMRENREESSFDFAQMMFGGPTMNMSMGMQSSRTGAYGNLGNRMPSRYSYQSIRGGEGSASTFAYAGNVPRRA